MYIIRNAVCIPLQILGMVLFFSLFTFERFIQSCNACLAFFSFITIYWALTFKVSSYKGLIRYLTISCFNITGICKSSSYPGDFIRASLWAVIYIEKFENEYIWIIVFANISQPLDNSRCPFLSSRALLSPPSYLRTTIIRRRNEKV